MEKFKAEIVKNIYLLKHCLRKTIKVYINGIEGFLGYAKEMLLRFNGINGGNFIYLN
jgi:hypothetical protein